MKILLIISLAILPLLGNQQHQIPAKAYALSNLESLYDDIAREDKRIIHRLEYAIRNEDKTQALNLLRTLEASNKTHIKKINNIHQVTQQLK